MYTKEESRILSICGWSEKELEYIGTKIFDVKSSKKENLLFLLTKVNNNEIVIEFCVPDTNGEKMKVIFDRVSQKLSNANNADILDNDTLNNLLNVISFSIKNNQKYSTFIPTKKNPLKM